MPAQFKMLYLQQQMTQLNEPAILPRSSHTIMT